MSKYAPPTQRGTVFNPVNYTSVNTNFKTTGGIITGPLSLNRVTTISSAGWITVPAPALSTDTTSYTITSAEMPVLDENYWSGVLTCYLSDQSTYSGTMVYYLNKPYSTALVANAGTKSVTPSANNGNTITAPSATTLSVNSTGKTKVTYVAWTLSYAKYPQ